VNLLTDDRFDIRHTVLPCGLTLVTVNTQSAFVSGSVVVAAGSTQDHEMKVPHGTAHFLEHMLAEGPGRDTGRHPLLVDVSCGVTMMTGLRETTYGFFGRREIGELALSRVCDMVFSSQWSPRDIAPERRVIATEIRRDWVSKRVWMESRRLTYPQNPEMWMSSAGREDSLVDIRQEQLSAFRERYYVPSRTIVIVAGGVDHDRIINLVSKRFGDSAPAGPDISSLRGLQIATGDIEFLDPETDGECELTYALPPRREDRDRLELFCATLACMEGPLIRRFRRNGDSYGVWAVVGDPLSPCVVVGGDSAGLNSEEVRCMLREVVDGWVNSINPAIARAVANRQFDKELATFENLEGKSSYQDWAGIVLDELLVENGSFSRLTVGEMLAGHPDDLAQALAETAKRLLDKPIGFFVTRKPKKKKKK
jgi:hypothetical protein